MATLPSLAALCVDEATRKRQPPATSNIGAHTIMIEQPTGRVVIDKANFDKFKNCVINKLMLRGSAAVFKCEGENKPVIIYDNRETQKDTMLTELYNTCELQSVRALSKDKEGGSNFVVIKNDVVVRCPKCKYGDEMEGEQTCYTQDVALRSAWMWLSAAYLGYGLPVHAMAMVEFKAVGYALLIMLPTCTPLSGEIGTNKKQQTQIIECLNKAAKAKTLFVDIKPPNMGEFKDSVYLIDQDSDLAFFVDGKGEDASKLSMAMHLHLLAPYVAQEWKSEFKKKVQTAADELNPNLKNMLCYKTLSTKINKKNYMSAPLPEVTCCVYDLTKQCKRNFVRNIVWYVFLFYSFQTSESILIKALQEQCGDSTIAPTVPVTLEINMHDIVLQFLDEEESEDEDEED